MEFPWKSHGNLEECHGNPMESAGFFSPEELTKAARHLFRRRGALSLAAGDAGLQRMVFYGTNSCGSIAVGVKQLGSIAVELVQLCEWSNNSWVQIHRLNMVELC